MKDLKVKKTELRKVKGPTAPKLINLSEEKQKRDRQVAAEAVARRAKKLGW